MKHFEFKVDKIRKRFEIDVNGFFTEKEGQEFMKEYNKIISSIKPSEYTFVDNAEDLRTSSLNMIPVLKEAIKMYMKEGFKKIYIVLPKDVTSTMQVRRLCREINFTGELVNSVSECR